MSVRRSAGAIFWALTLVAIGSLLLANNLGYSIHIWPYVVRYWPALLIGWGVLKFVDFFRFRRAGDTRPLFTGGEVALLIILIFAGSAITTAANVSPEIGNIFDIGDIDLWDITGNNYNYEQHLEHENVASGSEIEIVNYFGNVEVSSSDSDRITVDVIKTIRASGKEEADRLEQEFDFSVRGEGLKYRIKSNRDDSGIHSTPRQRFKSSLTIRVPKNSLLHLDNRNGHVSVQGLTGDQSLLNRYGDVDIRDITGGVQIENRNGNVTVQNITSSAVINNRYSNTTAKDIGGNLRIETRNGSVDVEGVKGDAAINNAYSPINVRDVAGGLTITGRNNPIDIDHVEGDINADSSYANITINDPRSAVTVTGRNGDVHVSFDKNPEKDVSIATRYANVTVELSSGSAFKIDARTEYGEIQSEFDDLHVNRSNRERVITGEVRQNGPHFTISTRNGDIRLQRRG